MVIVRPGEESVLIGANGGAIWLHYNGTHFSPLTDNADPNAVTYRRQHIMAIASYFRLKVSSEPQRSWKLAGGGRSVSEFSSVASARAASSARSARADSVAASGPSTAKASSVRNSSAPSARASLRSVAVTAQPSPRSAVSTAKPAKNVQKRMPEAHPLWSSRLAGAPPVPFFKDADFITGPPPKFGASAKKDKIRLHVANGATNRICRGLEALTPQADAALRNLNDAAAAYNAQTAPARERAARLAAAARTYRWLCVPSESATGWKCKRPGCTRSVNGGLTKLVSPNGAACHTYRGPELPRRERQATLIQLGLSYTQDATRVNPLRDNSKLRIRSSEFKAWSCPFCPFVVDPDAPRPWINRRLHLRCHGARGQKLLDEARGVPAGSKRASDIKLALAETRKRQGAQFRNLE